MRNIASRTLYWMREWIGGQWRLGRAEVQWSREHRPMTIRAGNVLMTLKWQKPDDGQNWVTMVSSCLRLEDESLLAVQTRSTRFWQHLIVIIRMHTNQKGQRSSSPGIYGCQAGFGVQVDMMSINVQMVVDFADQSDIRHSHWPKNLYLCNTAVDAMGNGQW